MGIIHDRTTGYWTLKTKTDDGKDRRIKLRQIGRGESSRPVPMDVTEMAAQHEHGSAVQTVNSRAAKLPPATEPTPLEPWLDRYLDRYSRDRRPASIQRMRYLLGLLKRFAKQQGIQTLNAITVEVMEDFVSWRYKQQGRIKKTVSKATVVAELRVLSGVFSSAVKVDRIPKNPVSPVIADESKGLPKDKPPKYLDPQQVQEFLKLLDRLELTGGIPSAYADLARVMLYSGIRLTAAMNMRFEWINPDWIVSIPITTDQVATKSKTGYQAVIIGDGRKVIERRKQLANGTGRVFPGVNRKDTVQWHFSKLKITPHQLRHSFAVAAVDSGVPLMAIQELMGHADIKTTAIYAKLRDKTKLSMADKIRFGPQTNN